MTPSGRPPLSTPPRERFWPPSPGDRPLSAQALSARKANKARKTRTQTSRHDMLSSARNKTYILSFLPGWRLTIDKKKAFPSLTAPQKHTHTHTHTKRKKRTCMNYPEHSVMEALQQYSVTYCGAQYTELSWTDPQTYRPIDIPTGKQA